MMVTHLTFAYENKFSSANPRTPTSTSPAVFTLSFDGKPSSDNPRTPTLVPRSGVLTIYYVTPSFLTP